MSLAVSDWEDAKANVAAPNKGLVCVRTTEYALMLQAPTSAVNAISRRR